MNAMLFIPAVNTARVTMEFTHYDSFACNVFHVHKPTVWDVVTLAQLVDVFETWWKNDKSICSPQTTLNRIVAKDMSVQDSEVVEKTIIANNVGTNAEPGHPSHVTFAVKWNTGFAGRSYRGRTYHIGLPLLTTSGNALLGSYLNSAKVHYETILTDIPAYDPNAVLVVASYYHNKAPRATAILTPIVSVTVDGTLDSQRRRLTGRGM